MAENKENRLSALVEMGYGKEIAERFISEYDAWPMRDEVSGVDNIGKGAETVGHVVESRYGYYGVTAPWTIGTLILKGGSGQLDTVFGWGLLCDSGLISDTGTAGPGAAGSTRRKRAPLPSGTRTGPISPRGSTGTGRASACTAAWCPSPEPGDPKT